MLKFEGKQPSFAHLPQTSQCSAPHQPSLRTVGMSRVPMMFPVLCWLPAGAAGLVTTLCFCSFRSWHQVPHSPGCLLPPGISQVNMLPRLLEGVEFAAYALARYEGQIQSSWDLFYLKALETLNKYINSLNFTGENLLGRRLSKGCETLEQVAQRGGGCSILCDVQVWAGQGSEHLI